MNLQIKLQRSIAFAGLAIMLTASLCSLTGNAIAQDSPAPASPTPSTLTATLKEVTSPAIPYLILPIRYWTVSVTDTEVVSGFSVLILYTNGMGQPDFQFQPSIQAVPIAGGVGVRASYTFGVSSQATNMKAIIVTTGGAPSSVVVGN